MNVGASSARVLLVEGDGRVLVVCVTPTSTRPLKRTHH